MKFCKYMSIALVLHGLGIICSLIFHDAWICNSPGRLRVLKRYPKVTYLLNRVRRPPFGRVSFSGRPRFRKWIFFRTEHTSAVKCKKWNYTTVYTTEMHKFLLYVVSTRFQISFARKRVLLLVNESCCLNLVAFNVNVVVE